MRKLESNDWWSELVALKDEMSLRELGERFGATPGAIMNAFKRNGIERAHAPPGPRKHRKKADEVAEELPPEPDGVSRTRGKDAQIEKFRELLGTVPDRIVAEKARVSLRTVAAYRARYGIPGYAGPRGEGKSKGRARGRRGSKIDPYASQVGKVADRVIAEKAGVTVSAVRAYRQQHGIPGAGRRSSTREKARPTPVPEAIPARAVAKVAPSAPATPAAPAPAPSASGAFAWRVSLVDGTVGVVVGRTIVEAATRAASAGEVASMERIGAILA